MNTNFSAYCAGTIWICTFLTATIVAATPEDAGSLLRQITWTRWEILEGKLVLPLIAHAPNRVFNQEIRDARESLAINSSVDHASMKYEFKRPQFSWQIEWVDGHFTLHETSANDNFQFEQRPTGAVSLILVRNSGEVVELTAADLWQFALVHPQVFQNEIAPRLERLRDHWRLQATADEIATLLQKESSSNWKKKRDAWQVAVEQLSSPDYIQRRQAHEQLSQVGREIVPFLRSLDLSTYDAEQQRQIQFFLGENHATSDQPAEIAAAYVFDHELWCNLIEYGDAETRSWAAAHLSHLLNRPLNLDLNAQASSRTAAIQEIRRMISPTRR